MVHNKVSKVTSIPKLFDTLEYILSVYSKDIMLVVSKRINLDGLTCIVPRHMLWMPIVQRMFFFLSLYWAFVSCDWSTARQFSGVLYFLHSKYLGSSSFFVCYWILQFEISGIIIIFRLVLDSPVRFFWFHHHFSSPTGFIHVPYLCGQLSEPYNHVSTIKFVLDSLSVTTFIRLSCTVNTKTSIIFVAYLSPYNRTYTLIKSKLAV